MNKYVAKTITDEMKLSDSEMEMILYNNKEYVGRNAIVELFKGIELRLLT